LVRPQNRRSHLMNPIASHDGLSREGRRDEGIAAASTSRAGKLGLRSNTVALASTSGFFGLGSITHGLTSLVSAPRIRHTEVVAEDSLRPTSGPQQSARSDVGRRRHPRRAPTVSRARSGSAQGCFEWLQPMTGIAGRGRGPSDLACARVSRQTRPQAYRSTTPPIRPLTIGQPDCPHDWCLAIGSPQAACGPAAHALKDAFATQASGKRGRGLRCPSFTG
jgi:hypothetical protein